MALCHLDYKQPNFGVPVAATARLPNFVPALKAVIELHNYEHWYEVSQSFDTNCCSTKLLCTIVI